jgi:uncharacterized protein YlxW (UPF0749 family)
MTKRPWAAVLIVAILGFMLAMQLKVHRAETEADKAKLLRTDELVQQLEQAEKERDALAAELAQARAQVRELNSAQDKYRVLAEQLEQAQLQAGLLPVTGPGVTVTMSDATRPLLPGENPNYLIIHDEDVLRVVNELLLAGAEAIAVNGQRLTSRSEIHCAGPVVIINKVRTSVPITIQAIGPADDLERAIMMKDGPAESLMEYGITVTAKREKELTLPAYKGSTVFQWGKVAPAEVKP